MTDLNHEPEFVTASAWKLFHQPGRRTAPRELQRFERPDGVPTTPAPVDYSSAVRLQGVLF